MATDFKKMLEILSNQSPKGIKSGNWPKIEFEIEDRKHCKIIHVNSDEVGFSFNSKGRFEGIFNWKE